MKVYNTRTRRKEEFEPSRDGEVKMYVCGPTVYDHSHLGHARASVVFDVIYRYLEHVGYDVDYVQNFTDVDDKIIERAREEEVDPLDLAEKYIEEFKTDMSRLGVRVPTARPRVTDHIQEIIEMIEVLIEKGYAYEIDGNVYFDISAYEYYGELSRRDPEELEAGARVAVSEQKKHPMDFSLWKTSKGEISWASPWGQGRPGWHIECSALAVNYLGESIDIHGGGQDLIFPHHENEIAQAEACTGCRPFARYWLHNGFVTVDREKMSKSLGNFFTIREVLDQYRSEAVRLFLISAHYRSPVDYTPARLDEAAKQLERFENTLERIRTISARGEGADESPEKDRIERALSAWPGGREAWRQLGDTRRGFREAMDDDFNTSLAVAQLHDLARRTNELLNAPDLKPAPEICAFLAEVEETFKELGGKVLGIIGTEAERERSKSSATEGELEGELIELLIELRSEARQEKNWELADKIRDRLGEIGILLEDTPYGTEWKRGDG